MSSFQIVAPEFLPPVSYFLPFLKSRIILIADHIQYTKRSNLTGSGSLKNCLRLKIPVKNTGFKKEIAEKEIAYGENWERKHLTSMYHLYHMLTYFDDYFYKLRDIYNKHHIYLNSFLFDQISFFVSSLKINCDLKLTSQQGFGGLLEESLIRFSKENSSKVFIYDIQDVKSGYVNIDKIHDDKVKTQARSNYNDSHLKHINILEFLFKYTFILVSRR